MSAPKLWYYCDVSGQQQGPVDDKALITEFNAGQVKDDCLIWCDSLPDWTPLAQVAEVYAQIQQTKTKTLPSAKVSSAAPRFGAGMPTKSNLVEEMAKKSLETLQQQNATKSSANANTWTKVVGDDGYPYYTNNETHETTWDRPADYHSDEEHMPEQTPKAEVKQVLAKAQVPKAANPITASGSTDSDIAELKAALAALKIDLEKTNSGIKDANKASEKSQQDKTQVQEKLIADLRTELAACKSELKEIKVQIAEFQKTVSSMQSSVKSASDSVAEIKASNQSQVKLIKGFAKSLADNLKE